MAREKKSKKRRAKQAQPAVLRVRRKWALNPVERMHSSKKAYDRRRAKGATDAETESGR